MMLLLLNFLLSVEAISIQNRASSSYPTPDVRGPAPLPAWIATYNAAKAAGRIPGIPPTVIGSNGLPAYPANQSSLAACSWTLNHCFGAYDVVDAPTGITGISFDDGPQLASPILYNFLAQKNQRATHFMIGSRIYDNPSIFQQALSQGEHIACHTWSHPYMTTMTDIEALGEIGWTNQIIYDKSGLVPGFWRPPYGDIDDRIRAIAHEVFGMYSVVWNRDTFDWTLTEAGTSSTPGLGPQTDAGLDAELEGFYNGPKSPGLIILEHELTSRSIGGFMRIFPKILSLGWSPKAIPDIWSVPWYLNAQDTHSPITPGVLVGNYFFTGNVAGGPTYATSTATATSTSSTASTTSDLPTSSTNVTSMIATIPSPSTFIYTTTVITVTPTEIPTTKPTAIGVSAAITTLVSAKVSAGYTTTVVRSSAMLAIVAGWIWIFA